MSCKHYKFQLIESDRHYINSNKHNNCVLCLAEDTGGMTQEEIARYFGLTKMRINQIEKEALRKIKNEFLFID